MSRRRFIEQERQLAAELNAKFRGTFNVKIEALYFPPEELNEEDEKNSKRLKNLFRKEKDCPDWEIFDHIPALIEQQELNDALARSGISSEQSLSARDGYLDLDFPTGFRLQSLRGRHRVLAAPPDSRRWTVDLFLSGKTKFLLDHMD